MKYSFNLEFDELDEELQEKKIDEVITYNFKNNEYDIFIEDDETKKDLDDLLEDDDIRDNARNYIEAHFPIYF